MTTSITSVEKVGTNNFKYTWTLDLGPVTVIQGDEVLSAGTDITSITVSSADTEEPPAIEVYDQQVVSGDVVPSSLSEQFSPFAILQWRNTTSNINYYVVDKFIDAAWVEQKKIRDNGVTYYQYETDILEDDTLHKFRISVVDNQGYVSSVMPFNIFMVRVPDVPSIDTAYDSGTGLITISAR